MVKVSRRAKIGTGAVVLLLLAVFFGLRWFEYSQVYHPTKRVVPWVLANDTGKQDFYFTNADGLKLNGWYFPAASGLGKNVAILVCHGNGGNITYISKLYSRLAATGASLLLFDYRGYGNSEGKPSEEGTYRDAQAAYAWLRQKGFAATNIFIYGESLGGGIASELALREPAGGLILESTFSSTPDVGALMFPFLPVHLISCIKYDTHKKLPQLHLPVLIMHSRDDRLIPFSLAEKNLAVANEPKMFWEIRGGHAAAGEEVQEGMGKFLSAIEVARREGREVKF